VAFHRKCDKKGWTLTIVKTTKNSIFGGFTTAEWESPSGYSNNFKPCPHSFLFSVNENRKFPIMRGGIDAIERRSDLCAVFGDYELSIYGYSNSTLSSYCLSNRDSFNLPSAKGRKEPSMNGGERNFQLKQFEVYSVTVRVAINIIFRKYERTQGES
jgi:BTB/POZ domain-containing protein KCTD9